MFTNMGPSLPGQEAGVFRAPTTTTSVLLSQYPSPPLPRQWAELWVPPWSPPGPTLSTCGEETRSTQGTVRLSDRSGILFFFPVLELLGHMMCRICFLYSHQLQSWGHTQIYLPSWRHGPTPMPPRVGLPTCPQMGTFPPHLLSC